MGELPEAQLPTRESLKVLTPYFPVKFSLWLYCSGAIAKRLCTGLQIHVGRFDSGSRLHLFGDPHSPKLRQDAPVVKLVDTRDLKSLGLWLCRFDSGPGHHSTIALPSPYLPE